MTPDTQNILMWAAGGVGTLLTTGGGALLRAIYKALADIQRSHGERHEETKDSLAKTSLKLTEITTALRGLNGDNGLVGDVEQLKGDVRRHERQLASLAVPRRRESDA